MKKTREKKPLEQKDIESLDEIISRLDQMLLWEILGITNTERAEKLRSRIMKIRKKTESEITETKSDQKIRKTEDYELNKDFFHKLQALLIDFTVNNTLGAEFDKRLAQRFAEIVIVCKKNARE